MQKIDDVEKPVIGKFYLVPCIYVRFYGRAEHWMPVIGTIHEDADLGVPTDHWHYDVRFFPKRFLSYPAERTLGKVYTGTFGVISYNLAPYELTPVFRRRRMLREMPDFPMGLKNQSEFEDRFADERLKSCLKCPHRGMPLRNLPQDASGNVVCNGHGLKWNLKTGRMVPRLLPL